MNGPIAIDNYLTTFEEIMNCQSKKKSLKMIAGIIVLTMSLMIKM